MKKALLFLLIFLSLTELGWAQRGGWKRIYKEIEKKDTTVVVELYPLVVLPHRLDTRKYARLIANLKKVYPIAKEANRTLQQIELEIAGMDSEKQQRKYIKQMEQELKSKYTPVLKRMTFSQGKILIKLIDRETTHTSYDLVKELRGGLSAFMWQGVARLFGANLKDRYDRYGEDQALELLILLYEAGEL